MIEPLQWKKNFINSPKMISELLFSNLKSLETKKLVNPTSKENTIGTHKREQHQKYHLIRIKARREYFDVIHGKATSEALFRQTHKITTKKTKVKLECFNQQYAETKDYRAICSPWM